MNPVYFPSKKSDTDLHLELMRKHTKIYGMMIQQNAVIVHIQINEFNTRRENTFLFSPKTVTFFQHSSDGLKMHFCNTRQ